MLLRVVNVVTARAWRMPALVLLFAAVAGWVLILIFEPAHAEIRRPINYLWYFFISGTTVGYGDFFPESVGGRIGGVLIIGSGLTAGLVLFAELTVWMARGRTLKANGLAELRLFEHVVIIGYDRPQLLQILEQVRADPKYRKLRVVVIFWPDQLSGENPDPEQYDIVLYNETAFSRACLEKARTVLVTGRTDDETVRVMLGVCAYLRKHGSPDEHLVAGVHDGNRRAEITEALGLICPDIEPVDSDSPAVIADAIRNPGVATIYHNLASTLDSDASLFRVDIPDGVGEWTRIDLGVHFLRLGHTLLAVGESHRPNARFRLAAEPGETVRGGQSLAIVAKERPQVSWSDLAGQAVLATSVTEPAPDRIGEGPSDNGSTITPGPGRSDARS